MPRPPRSLAATAAALAVVATVATVAACTSSTGNGTSGAADSPASSAGSSALPFRSLSPAASSAGESASSDSASSAAESASTRSHAQAVFDGMSERQRIGQLLMVDCPSTGVSTATADAIRRYHVGSVILDGTTTAGRDAVHAVTVKAQSLAGGHARLLVATDQEGGEVQRLQGSGFSRIPSGVQQGHIAPATLQRDAKTWAVQLRKAGVDVNLAPVLDTVPSSFGSNPPIGDLDREYGHTPGAVQSHGVAFLQGMAAGGVDATAKHFPGLGRVHGNTDTSANVTDTSTTRHSSYLAPFHAAVRAGVPLVMMSTAVYAKIDPHHPAAFSKTIVTGMLRHDLGFRGLVISDDLGAAKQVSRYPVGQRAVDFVAAGGDIVLTVDASQAGTMTTALLHQAAASTAFRAQVNAAALLVLQAKQAAGLLH